MKAKISISVVRSPQQASIGYIIKLQVPNRLKDQQNAVFFRKLYVRQIIGFNAYIILGNTLSCNEII